MIHAIKIEQGRHSRSPEDRSEAGYSFNEGGHGRWKWHLGQNVKEMKHERKREWTWEQTVIMFSLRFFFAAFNISRSFSHLEETHFLDSSLPLTAFPSLDLRIQTKYLLRGTVSASEVTEPLLVGGGLVCHVRTSQFLALTIASWGFGCGSPLFITAFFSSSLSPCLPSTRCQRLCAWLWAPRSV